MDPSAMPPALAMDLTTSFGPAYWGVVLTGLFQGILMLQVYGYHNSSRDGWLLKTIVWVVLVLDTVNFLLAALGMNSYFVVNWGNPIALGSIDWQITTEALTSIIIVLIVQLYLAFQIYRFQKKLLVYSIAVVFCSMAGFGCLLSSVVQNYMDNSVAGLGKPSVKIAILAGDGFAGLADLFYTIVIAITLTASQGDVARTNFTLNKIILWTVHRGVLVFTLQIGILVATAAWPDKLYWIPLHFIASKVYSNTFVAMLNARGKIRGYLEDPSWSSTYTSDTKGMALRHMNRSNGTTTLNGSQGFVKSQGTHAQELGIYINKDITYFHDDQKHSRDVV